MLCVTLAVDSGFLGMYVGLWLLTADFLECYVGLWLLTVGFLECYVGIRL